MVWRGHIVTSSQLISVAVLWQFVLCVYVTEDEDSTKIVEQTVQMSISMSQSPKVWSVLYFTLVVIDRVLVTVMVQG